MSEDKQFMTWWNALSEYDQENLVGK